MAVTSTAEDRSFLRLVSSEEFEAREQTALVAATLGPPLMEYLERVYAVENPKMAGGSPASLSDYATQVRNLQRYWDELRKGVLARPLHIGDCTYALLAAAKKWQLDQGLSVATANKLGRTLQSIVNHAIENQGLDLRPVKIGRYKQPRHKPKAWRADRIIRLLLAARDWPGMVGPVPAGKWHLAHLLTILNTGLRINAMMWAPTAELDLDAGWLSIPADAQKDKEALGFDLLPITVAALRAIHPYRNEFVFQDWPHGRRPRPQRCDWRSLAWRLKKMLVVAGLAKSTEDNLRRELFHKLRRSFATLVASKFGKYVAQQLLGHSHISVTEMYLDEELLERPKISDAMSGAIVLPEANPQVPLFDWR